MSQVDQFNTVTKTIIPPQEYYSRTVYKGQVLRITDLEGQQVADFLCFNKEDLEDKLSVENTLLINGTIYITKGNRLYSSKCHRMFTIIEDTCGRHDLICGSCSEYTNAFRYGIRGTPNCRTNFSAALAPYGIEPNVIPYSFNIFMNAPVQPDGSIAIEQPISKAGDFIELRADMDCIIAISNCPQERNPCNAYRPTKLEVMIYEPNPVPLEKFQ